VSINILFNPALIYQKSLELAIISDEIPLPAFTSKIQQYRFPLNKGDLKSNNLTCLALRFKAGIQS
jgi:hypothetical protein